MPTLLIAFLSLTLPQRKAMAAHLTAYVTAALRANLSPAITMGQAEALAFRLLSTAVANVTPTDMAVLEAAVYLSPARNLIPATTARALERAWTRLGWTWTWPGHGFRVDRALEAEAAIRALLNPPQAPPAPEGLRPGEVVIGVVTRATAADLDLSAEDLVDWAAKSTPDDILGDLNAIAKQLARAPRPDFVGRLDWPAPPTGGPLFPRSYIVVDDPMSVSTPEGRRAALDWFRKTIQSRALTLGPAIYQAVGDAVQTGKTLPDLTETLAKILADDPLDRGLQPADLYTLGFIPDRIVPTGEDPGPTEEQVRNRVLVVSRTMPGVLETIRISGVITIPPTEPDTVVPDGEAKVPDLDWEDVDRQSVLNVLWHEAQGEGLDFPALRDAALGKVEAWDVIKGVAQTAARGSRERRYARRALAIRNGQG